MLVLGEGGEGVGEDGAVGQGEGRVQLEQRGEDEAAVAHLRVRQGEAIGLQLEFAQQQQVDVEWAGAVAGQVELAAALGLDRLAGVEQLLGRKVYLQLQVKASPKWLRNETMLERLGL